MSRKNRNYSIEIKLKAVKIYLEEIQNIKIEIKQGKKEDNKIKLQIKLNILNEEYKMLVNQVKK